MLNSGNQCPQACPVEFGSAAPGLAAIVGEIRPRVAVAHSTARCCPDAAVPGESYVVVRTSDEAPRIVGIHRDGSFVLRSSPGVLVYRHVRREDTGPVQRAGQDLERSDGS